MDVSSINIINNPLTFYKLDPGEPGIAPPTPASQSAFTVFSQEARNRQRMKAEALMEGKEVIFLNTEYKVRKNGSFLTIVGGTTTIVTREKEKKETNDISEITQENKSNSTETNSDNQLKIKEDLLKTEQKKLKSKWINANENEKRVIEKRLKDIEIELKKIEKIKQIKNEKQKKRSISPFDNALNGLLEALNNPAGLLLDLMI